MADSEPMYEVRDTTGVRVEHNATEVHTKKASRVWDIRMQRDPMFHRCRSGPTRTTWHEKILNGSKARLYFLLVTSPTFRLVSAAFGWSTAFGDWQLQSASVQISTVDREREKAVIV